MLPEPIENSPKKGKSISDPIYGFVNLKKEEVDLIDTPQLQRLRNIKQLGLSHLTYPSACHTRFEHTLGVTHVVQQMANGLGLDSEATEVNRLAAILHDTGHGPFSHASEQIQGTEMEHTDYSCKVVEELEHKIDNDISKIKNIITGKRNDDNLIQGAINSDRIDYLMRDSHHAGVEHGQIDVNKIFESLMKQNDNIVFNSRAIQSVENLLISRFHMYKSVYKHHTCRASEKMLTLCMNELVEKLGKEKVMRMDDPTFKREAEKHLDDTQDVLDRIEKRNLYRPCYEVNNINTNKETLKKIEKKIDPVQLKKELSESANIPEKKVIIDPIEKPGQIRNIKIYDNDRVYNLQKFSGIARGLDMWELEKLSIFTPKEHRKEVGSKAKEILTNKLEV